jgi:dTDP-D-glucose 4,6-dehydratase
MQITQLGHVADLADAFVRILGNAKAAKQVYNIAGDKYATFDGIAKACAAAAGAPPPELVHFNAKEFDFGKAKAFPMRDQHFFADVAKAKAELGWAPKYDMLSGLKDSYAKDFGRGTFREAPDWTADDMILVRGRWNLGVGCAHADAEADACRDSDLRSSFPLPQAKLKK